MSASKKASKKKHSKSHAEEGLLKGWAAIADFLKMPPATAQRWAKAGMPIKREGRFTTADPDELREWLGREAKMPAPAHIATNTADLSRRIERIHRCREEGKEITRNEKRQN